MFTEKLKALRLQRGLNKKQMSELLQMKYTTYNNYETGTREPNSDFLKVVSKEFNVTIDYLLDNDEIKKSPTPTETEVRENSEVINAISPKSMVPIVGSIPAGIPVLAQQNIIGYYPALVSSAEEHFFLRVKGDSMINAGIKDGCLVLIKKQNTADNGQIVACRVNGDEATLKRFKQIKDTIILMPENPDFDPILVHAKEFEEGYAEIIGVAKSVVTKL